MRMVSKKVLTALRRVSRARPASAPPAFAAPLICTPALLGSQFNPIFIDGDDLASANDVSTAVHNVPAGSKSHPLADSLCELPNNFCVAGPPFAAKPCYPVH